MHEDPQPEEAPSQELLWVFHDIDPTAIDGALVPGWPIGSCSRPLALSSWEFADAAIRLTPPVQTHVLRRAKVIHARPPTIHSSRGTIKRA